MTLEFGKNLKKLRRERDLTQEELAEVLSLSVKAISRYETGDAYPDIEMLPVIAGYFGTTVDELLGVSTAVREQRMENYALALRKLTDRRERLALLRREHAEFPDSWELVSDMMYEMTFLPDCLPEMRKTAEDAMRHCYEPLWRENILLSYLQAEPEEDAAQAFIDRWCSRYDIRKTELLRHRYQCRGDRERGQSISQKLLRDQIEAALQMTTGRTDCTAEENLAACHAALAFLQALSGTTDPTEPDMWVTLRLTILSRLANCCFALMQNAEGYAVLETEVTLFERFFALPNGTRLTYGTPKLSTLSAVTGREVFYQITEFTGMIAQSMMMNLLYETPIGHVNENEKGVYDMEGFERTMVFSSHTYNMLNSPDGWEGFKRVREEPRYLALLNRVKAVSSLENPENLLFLMRSGANRTDEWVEGIEWLTALLIRDVGAYVIWGQKDLAEKIESMQREGNTKVDTAVTAQVGGWICPTPEAVLRSVLHLDPANAEAKVIVSAEPQPFIMKTISELL